MVDTDKAHKHETNKEMNAKAPLALPYSFLEKGNCSGLKKNEALSTEIGATCHSTEPARMLYMRKTRGDMLSRGKVCQGLNSCVLIELPSNSLNAVPVMFSFRGMSNSN